MEYYKFLESELYYNIYNRKCKTLEFTTFYKTTKNVKWELNGECHRIKGAAWTQYYASGVKKREAFYIRGKIRRKGLIEYTKKGKISYFL